jgi:chromatin segregation and condensation protein Rec8/ScpA/Scc1 (kleisin family)
MSSADDPESLLDELPLDDNQPRVRGENPKLMPKTPQPRKRKVSVDDLIRALEKALEVEVRRPPSMPPPKVQIRLPHKSIDVAELINDVYVKVQDYYTQRPDSPQILTFTQLIPSDSKEDKVFTFIPLLQLENQRKVDMHQKVHFGDIDIHMAKPKTQEQVKQEETKQEEKKTPEPPLPENKPKRGRPAKDKTIPEPVQKQTQ